MGAFHSLILSCFEYNCNYLFVEVIMYNGFTSVSFHLVEAVVRLLFRGFCLWFVSEAGQVQRSWRGKDSPLQTHQ